MPPIDSQDAWKKIANVGGGIMLIIVLVSAVWLLTKQNNDLAISIFTGGCYLELVHIRYMLREWMNNYDRTTRS